MVIFFHYSILRKCFVFRWFFTKPLTYFPRKINICHCESYVHAWVICFMSVSAGLIEINCYLNNRLSGCECVLASVFSSLTFGAPNKNNSYISVKLLRNILFNILHKQRTNRGFNWKYIYVFPVHAYLLTISGLMVLRFFFCKINFIRTKALLLAQN